MYLLPFLYPSIPPVCSAPSPTPMTKVVYVSHNCHLPIFTIFTNSCYYADL